MTALSPVCKPNKYIAPTTTADRNANECLQTCTRFIGIIITFYHIMRNGITLLHLKPYRGGQYT